MYGFKERRHAEILKEIAESRISAGVSSSMSSPVIGNGSRIFLISLPKAIPAFQDGLPGAGEGEIRYLQNLSELSEDGTDETDEEMKFYQYEEDQENVKWKVRNLTGSPIPATSDPSKPEELHMAVQDSFGTLYLIPEVSEIFGTLQSDWSTGDENEQVIELSEGFERSETFTAFPAPTLSESLTAGTAVTCRFIKALGKWFFFRPSGGITAVRAKGAIYSWLRDVDHPSRTAPILADSPVTFSYYLNGDSSYPAERRTAEFKAAAVDTRARLWRWVKNSDNWHISEPLPNQKSYACRNNEITEWDEVFGGKFNCSNGWTFYPAYLGTRFWKDTSIEGNLFSDSKQLNDTRITDGYILAYQTDIDPLDGPVNAQSYTAEPTAEYLNIRSAETFTMEYKHTIHKPVNGEWTDTNGNVLLFGCPYWTINGEDFHLAPVGDGTAYQLEGTVTIGEIQYRNLTWNENREEWILGTYGASEGWYFVKHSALQIADNWKFSGKLIFQKNPDTDDEVRDPLDLKYAGVNEETFTGSALIIHLERLQ